MDKINKFLDEKIMPHAGKLQGQKHFNSIFLGMSMAMPLIVVGSIAMVITYLPIPNWDSILLGFGDLGSILSKITNGSFGVMSLVVVFGVAYNLAKHYSLPDVSVGILSLSSFIIITPYLFGDEGAKGIPYNWLGSSGLFTAIIMGIVSTEIYRFFVIHDWTIKMPSNVPEGVSASFSSILPGFTIIGFWALLDAVVVNIGFSGLHDVVSTLIAIPLTNMGGGFGGTLIAIVLVSMIWFLGIHGTDLIGAIMYPIWYSQMDMNRAAFEAGLSEMPNIISYPLLTNFIWLGGGGATLALAILLVFRSKSKQAKTIGKLSIIPSLFNINEPIMFGLPIVLNPIMLIPYILAPLTNFLITYFLMSMNIVQTPVGINPSWTMPIGLSGAIATNWNIPAIVLQFILLAIDICIYYPFFKMVDQKQLTEENEIS